LAEDFVGGSNELGVRGGFGIRGRRGDGSLLGMNGGTTKEEGEAQEKSAQLE